MKFLLLLVMLTACAATPQDLSGKMFIFPQETSTAHVRLTASKQGFGAVTVCHRSFTDLQRDCCKKQEVISSYLSGKMFVFPEETSTANVRLTTSAHNFSAATVCLRSITDLSRNHALFSLSTSTAHNAFLIFKTATSDVIDLYVQDKKTGFGALDYKLNAWHSICSTWDSESGLVQLWLDGKPTIKKFVGGSEIKYPIAILGQDQDNHGGGFDSKQSFVGMMSDVHMWNYVLSPCEIKRYVDDLNFTPGNLINWRALEYNSIGRVLIENKQTPCGMPTKCKE